MKTILAVVFTALTACQATTSTEASTTTTTSAQMQPRRRAAPPPSPPPTMGQMPNSSMPLPQFSEDTATIPDVANPPPGTSVTETVTPTVAKRDQQIEKSLRKAIDQDNTLTTEGKQVEILVKDRKVVLKGQAHTEQERMNIDTKARATDDVIDVDDQIQLVP